MCEKRLDAQTACFFDLLVVCIQFDSEQNRDQIWRQMYGTALVSKTLETCVLF